MQSAWHTCGQQLLTRQRWFHCSHTYNCQWLGDQHLKIPPPANADQVELSCKGVLCTYTVHTYIDRYVCTYISMYVCMYVHMYVRAYVCMCVALHYKLFEYKGAHLGTPKVHTSVHQRCTPRYTKGGYMEPITISHYLQSHNWLANQT